MIKHSFPFLSAPSAPLPASSSLLAPRPTRAPHPARRYSSNTHHWEEAELSRLDMEPMLAAAHVDLVISGHVHAFERTAPMVDFKPQPCGPAYINIGDGGNREGAALPWHNGSQPAWSAFREGSFGVGRLDVPNATHAHFSWSRSACEAKDAPGHITFNSSCDSGGGGGFANVTSDAVWLVRSADRASCGRGRRSRDA